MAVPAHSDASHVAPTALEDLGEDDELHVLHARQERAVPVVDPDADLDGAHVGIGEGDPGLRDRLRVEAAVGVHDADHHVSGRALEVALAHQGERVVERLPLALPGIRGHPPHDVDPGVADGVDEVGRAVLRSVVDDEDVDLGVRDLQQLPDAGDDDLGLVQAGDEDDHPGTGEVARLDRAVRQPFGESPTTLADSRRASRDDEHRHGVDDGRDDHEERAPPPQGVQDGDGAGAFVARRDIHEIVVPP